MSPGVELYARFTNVSELEALQENFNGLVRMAKESGSIGDEIKTYERHLVYIRLRIEQLIADS